jgi:hypothetical protein
MHLNVKGFALATGVLWGLALFALTLVATGRGAGGTLGHLEGVFIGYKVNYLGSVVGLVYGFTSGLVAGALLASVYNRFAIPKG